MLFIGDQEEGRGRFLTNKHLLSPGRNLLNVLSWVFIPFRGLFRKSGYLEAIVPMLKIAIWQVPFLGKESASFFT